MYKYIIGMFAVSLLLVGCGQGVPTEKAIDNKDTEEPKTAVEEKKEEVKKEVEKKKVVVEEKKEIWKVFENKEFGFRFDMTADWKGLGQADLALPTGVKTLRYYVSSMPYDWMTDEYDVFYISIYPIDWWTQNAGPTDENGIAYYKDKPKNQDSLIGKLIDKNNKYAFVWTQGEECPAPEDSNHGPEDSKQCKLLSLSNELLESFEGFDL